MSSVVVLQTYDRLWIGSDSAVSTSIGGVTYRWHEGGQKLWVLDDSVIFCSGRAELADSVMREFHSVSDRSMERLQEIAIRQHDAYMSERNESFEVGVELFLTILVCKYEQGKTVVYGLEPHNGFELTARILDNPTNFAIWSGGIKVNESATAAMSKFSDSMNVIQTFQHAFDEISYEGIGGELTVYEIDRGTVKPFMHTRIKEKHGLKRLTERIVQAELKRLRAELVNAEVVSGQLGNFVSMVIGSGNDVTKINTNGISAGHNDFNSAPFRVNHQGDVVARSIKLTGEVSQSDVISSVIRASQIIGNEIEGGKITGASIIGGSITSNTDISVTRDARIGNNLFMGLAGAVNDRRIEFVDPSIYEAFISFAGSTSREVKIRGANDVRIDAGLNAVIKGAFDVSLEPGNGKAYVGDIGVPGNRIVTASELDALWSALNSKANFNHSHTLTLQNHNHGSATLVPSGGGTFTVS